jgi:predicted nuclease with TOPRIM domain
MLPPGANRESRLRERVIELTAERDRLLEENARLRAGAPVLHPEREVVAHYREIEQANDDLTAERDRLAEELRRLRAAVKDSRVVDRLAELEAERDRLAAALRRYGGHGADCPAGVGSAPCTCGLAAALRTG